MHNVGTTTLMATVNTMSNVLFWMPNRIKCILLLSVMLNTASLYVREGTFACQSIQSVRSAMFASTFYQSMALPLAYLVDVHQPTFHTFAAIV
jgi:hypothetical protein